MDIQDIIRAIDSQNYRITHHADEEAQDDDLDFEGIFYSVQNGEIIENYPEDRPYPSCLIYGSNADGEPIHSVWGIRRDESTGNPGYRLSPRPSTLDQLA